jgi:phosphoglycolate phosphatase-like HAD superfamily hydrolase
MNIGLDLDGTLLDSRERHRVALLRAAEEERVTLPAGLAESFVREKAAGFSGVEVLNRHGVSRAAAIGERWVALIELEGLLDLDRLYPGALEVLAQAAAQGIDFHLVTARRNRESAACQIRSLGLEQHCRSIHIVDPSSPEAAGRAGVAKARATRCYGLNAVIGDSEVDWEWARLIGVGFYPVSYGFRNDGFWLGRGLSAYPDLVGALRAATKSGPSQIGDWGTDRGTGPAR